MCTLVNRTVFGLTLAGSIVAAGASYAAPARPPGVEGHTVSLSSGASNAHKLVSVVVDQSPATGLALASGFTTIDSNSVTCAKPTCTIAVDMTVEAGQTSTSPNRWAACALVDGSYASTCAYAGELDADGTYLTGTLRNSFSVAKGTHSVSVQAYVDYTAYLGSYDIQYQVLTP